jgi:hypothetical protein
MAHPLADRHTDSVRFQSHPVRIPTLHRLLSHPKTGDALLFVFFAAIFTVLIHG